MNSYLWGELYVLGIFDYLLSWDFWAKILGCYFSLDYFRDYFAIISLMLG